MGLFSKPQLKRIESDSIMKSTFPNFYSWVYDAREYLKSELSACDSTLIEFRMPIMTYGNIMGHNYIGIENVNGGYFIYMNTVSRKGRKIYGKKIQIYKDLIADEYNEKVKELSIYLATETEYLQITIGNI
jgi:hypothetical protein